MMTLLQHILLPTVMMMNIYLKIKTEAYIKDLIAGVVADRIKSVLKDSMRGLKYLTKKN